MGDNRCRGSSRGRGGNRQGEVDQLMPAIKPNSDCATTWCACLNPKGFVVVSPQEWGYPDYGYAFAMVTLWLGWRPIVSRTEARERARALVSTDRVQSAPLREETREEPPGAGRQT